MNWAMQQTTRSQVEREMRPRFATGAGATPRPAVVSTLQERPTAGVRSDRLAQRRERLVG